MGYSYSGKSQSPFQTQIASEGSHIMHKYLSARFLRSCKDRLRSHWRRQWLWTWICLLSWKRKRCRKLLHPRHVKHRQLYFRETSQMHIRALGKEGSQSKLITMLLKCSVLPNKLRLSFLMFLMPTALMYFLNIHE